MRSESVRDLLLVLSLLLQQRDCRRWARRLFCDVVRDLSAPVGQMGHMSTGITLMSARAWCTQIVEPARDVIASPLDDNQTIVSSSRIKRKRKKKEEEEEGEEEEEDK